MKTITVNIATLKAKLSEYLRMVKKGDALLVVEHNHPVAKVSGINEDEPADFQSVKPVRSPNFKSFFPARRAGRSFSSLDVLLEDRKRR